MGVTWKPFLKTLGRKVRRPNIAPFWLKIKTVQLFSDKLHEASNVQLSLKGELLLLDLPL